MLLTIRPVSAEALADLRAPLDLPAGAAFQVITMEADLSGDAGYRLTASVILAGDVSSAEMADWLWGHIAGPPPPVVSIGSARARIGEPAALAWLIDRARAEAG